MVIAKQPSIAIGASAFLHGAILVAALVFAYYQPERVVPRGAPLVEIAFAENRSAAVSASAPAAPPKAALKLAPSPNGLAKKAKEENTAPQEAVRSTAESAPARSGPVGEANGQEVPEIQRYLFELRAILEKRKTYPTLSRRLREAGEVLISFKVLRDGTITSIALAGASAHDRLNEAAMQLVSGLGKFRALPENREELSVKIPVRYALE